MRRFTYPSSSHSTGFTLLEMMITLAIFLLLAAAVFGTLTGVLQSSSSLRDNQNRRDSIAALNAYLKKKMAELPASSVLLSYRRNDGAGLAQNGIVLGKLDGATIIDAVPQSNGLYTLRHGSVAFGGSGFAAAPGQIMMTLPEPLVTEDNSDYDWVPLIRDVKTIHWKFQDLGTAQWSDLWSNANAKPNVVEFSMQLAGDLQPVVMDFWIPRVDQPSLTIAPQTLTPATTHAP